MPTLQSQSQYQRSSKSQGVKMLMKCLHAKVRKHQNKLHLRRHLSQRLKVHSTVS
uniref:Uncharacterized protein n=1 Tax=Arundo donax TaxID=35708 RepID=A0A0A9G1Y9_ARUDO